MNTLTTIDIKKLAQEVGFDACGITRPTTIGEAAGRVQAWVNEGKHGDMKYMETFEDRAKVFWNDFPDAKSIIVLGVNYYSDHNRHSRVSGNLSSDAGMTALTGRIARYAWGKDYHQVIRDKIEVLKYKIEKISDKSLQFELCIDTKPLPERYLGEQAGLGFIGKQTQLLSYQFGPWLFLAELITDLELESDQPFQGSCGTCTLCIEACPTEAIEPEKQIDARKCIAYLTIENKGPIPEDLRDKIGNWVFGCDICLDVCPYTKFQQESQTSELKQAAGTGAALDLLKLFEIPSQGAYEREFKDSAVLRARRKHLLRNACVVLGNSKDQVAIPILQKAMQDSSELVREHAAWALQKIRGKGTSICSQSADELE